MDVSADRRSTAPTKKARPREAAGLCR